MAPRDRRTSEQIREEIRTERTQLDAALAALRADSKRLAQVAGSVSGALAGLLVLVRLRARRRRD
jgi:uncharacterized protein YcfJ